MSPLLSQVFMYMSGTFLLGLVLGWIVWQLGSAKERAQLQTEAEFWKSQLNEARRKRDEDIKVIDSLRDEKASLKKRLTAVAS